MTVFAAKSAFFKVRTDEGTCQSDLSSCLVAATCSGCSTHGVTSPLEFSINIWMVKWPCLLIYYVNIAFLLTFFFNFFPRHDRDHSRFNCNDGSRKTILKRSEDRSITEDEKKSSILAFYKARTRWLRAIAKSLHNEGHITIRASKEENQRSVTCGDVKVVKETIMEESVVKDS